MKKICFFGVVFIVFFNFISCSSVPQKEVSVEYRSLIINADDLCQNRKTNEAILKCYNEGIVTSTTAFVNFPDSIELLKEVHEQYPDFPIGIHLNMTFGKPVLPPEEIPTMVNKNGDFWNEDQIWVASPRPPRGGARRS